MNRTRIKSHRLPERLKGDVFYFEVYKGLIAYQYFSFSSRGDEGMNDIEAGGSFVNGH